jgi:hypothetical protein
MTDHNGQTAMHFEKSDTPITAALIYRFHMLEIGAGRFGALHGHVGVVRVVPELEPILIPPSTTQSVHIAHLRVGPRAEVSHPWLREGCPCATQSKRRRYAPRTEGRAIFPRERPFQGSTPPRQNTLHHRGNRHPTPSLFGACSRACIYGSMT